MSTTTLPGAKAEPPAPQTAAPAAPTVDAKFPRPGPDPQDDWPKDVRLPDDFEEGEC